ncbi:hypothetical protein GH714_041129 [Hevea brasiliensis]|uniref:Phosphatidic acid phosphatase type 2/haloperoxidase domain-containing protein n=1 Tax=Hevea brasiliensis TaxID=3981 RepID=A0A6A6MXE9_HEVBR|nr:hypothetical protein GH714_041129 [Hevea brasiliensis]
MREVDLGAHTIRSHGAKLARNHMHDWLILLLLAVIEIILYIIHPFYRFVGKDMMEDLKYPFKDNTVPTWSVPVVATLLPFVIIVVYYFIRKDVYDLHHAILGLLFSVLITGVITDAIKDAVGRPRPDFFWRCFPDGKGGPLQVLVFCHALVGISRVDDYWHHWQDVFAGALIGLTVASFCYLQFFPPPYDIDGWGPHAYFQMLAESQNGAQSSNNSNFLNVRESELQSVYIDSQHHSVNSRDRRPILEGTEGERRQ